MKNTHTCPKCNSTDITRIEGKAGAYGVGNNIQTGWANFPLFWFIVMFAVPAAILRNGLTKRIFPNWRKNTSRYISQHGRSK